jgi:hypothetical protein
MHLITRGDWVMIFSKIQFFEPVHGVLFNQWIAACLVCDIPYSGDLGGMH